MGESEKNGGLRGTYVGQNWKQRANSIGHVYTATEIGLYKDCI